MYFKATGAALVAGLLFVSGGAWADSYIIMANGDSLPKKLDSEIRAAGGTITARVPQIGIAIAESDDPGFADRAAGIRKIRSVMNNVSVRWTDPETPSRLLSFEEAAANPPTSGDDDFYFDLQWHLDAIDAPEAWEANRRGAGVRVAVLDSGIDSSHPDLTPNLNTLLSTSFVPGQTVDSPPGSHGTHVAGTIAAADNAMGVIGVAPEAELVAVKVLDPTTGSGAFSQIIQGIVYAAVIDADVINMSLGANIPRNCTFPVLDDDGNPTGETEHFPARDCAALVTAQARAVKFANQMGTTVIAAAGNDGRDLNHDASLKSVPAELPGVVSISATGPVGWALDPTVFLDNLSSYSNFGQSGVDFAAPGGDFVLPGNDLCAVAGVLQLCWVYDMVFSTFPGGWGWSAGTSMASPHAAGVAALIIGDNGGDMKPSQVISALRRSADDLGQPGKDAAYGNGRVNAANPY